MATPTAQLLASAAATLTARDADGREITLKRLNALDRLRLFKALGPVLSQNTMYLGMASLAVSVTAIDMAPVPAPMNESQLEALIARLGDCGLAAIAEALTESELGGGDAGNTTAGN